MSAKKSILVLGFLFLMASASAQTDFQEFYRISRSNNNTGMIILGSWAVLNMATGARGMAVNTGSVKYFHQMNLFWNTVNLGIAGFALVSGHLADDALLTSSQMMEKHLKTEKILLINAGLDVLYMAGGAFMLGKSNNSSKRPEMLKGYGQSLLLQGGFLLVFDLALYTVQHHLSVNFAENVQLSLSPQSFMLTLNF